MERVFGLQDYTFQRQKPLIWIIRVSQIVITNFVDVNTIERQF